MSEFADFARAVASYAPRTGMILGSGLAQATHAFREIASVPFGAIPGLVPPSVHGHGGKLALGTWHDTPALLFHGRLHFYEGHAWNVVTGTVRTLAELGVKRVVLTNAAGGIHTSLVPGELMAIRGHIKWLGAQAWRACASDNALSSPYSAALLTQLQSQERVRGRELYTGVYAALTGPSYETPAEIRALAACQADAVGMSTAMEAEDAATRGLEVVGISCITNKAAGLGNATLDHSEVLVNAKLAVTRMAELLASLV